MEVAECTLALRIAFVGRNRPDSGVFDNAASQREATVELLPRSHGYILDSHSAGRSSKYEVFGTTKYLAIRVSKRRGGGSSPGCMYFTQCTTTYTLLLCSTRRELTLTLSRARRCTTG